VSALELQSNSHLHIAQWLLSIKPEMNISMNDEGVFRYVCQFGRLNVAQWLLTIKPTINISASNNYGFISACEYGRA
jgi:hypothetical protein